MQLLKKFCALYQPKITLIQLIRCYTVVTKKSYLKSHLYSYVRMITDSYLISYFQMKITEGINSFEKKDESKMYMKKDKLHK